MVFEGFSFSVALREFRRTHAGEPLFSAIRRSKDPSVFSVLLEDSAALAGLLIALAGLALAEWLGMPELDGAASIGIGLVLVARPRSSSRTRRAACWPARAPPRTSSPPCARCWRPIRVSSWWRRC